MLFADRLVATARAHGPLCVGIDPHPGRIPDLFGGDTPDGVEAWGQAIVAAATGRVAAIKPQMGLFERLGPAGVRAFQAVCAAGREAGLMVLADAKRGDIGSTAEGYARAYLAADAPFASDAVTVNPYMGCDTLMPFVETAAETGRGVIVLARTSNPGSADFQARDLEGAPLYVRVVETLAPLIETLRGENGWSGLMLVAGATGPEEARALRALAPDALFLVPGYGAQGAGEAAALAGFVPGPHGLEGGLVNASRSITFPPGSDKAATQSDWMQLIVAQIDRAQAALRAAAHWRASSA